MKTFLLITTAVVALGAAPAFAAGANNAKMNSGSMNQAAASDSRMMSQSGSMNSSPRRAVRGSRAQLDAQEVPVTRQLNLEAQQAAGVSGTSNSQMGMNANRTQMGTQQMGTQSGMQMGGAAAGNRQQSPNQQLAPTPRGDSGTGQTGNQTAPSSGNTTTP